MQANQRRQTGGFTLIELLTVIVVIGILAAVLLPALNSAREKGKRVACASNLRQIGLAIMSYSSDFQNHTPTANNNFDKAVTPRNFSWNYALLERGYITAKVFVCPDDRRLNSGTITSCSYGMIVGFGNTSPTDFGAAGSGNYWIGGSRLTCPYLTNTAVAIIGEFLSDSPSIQPTVQQTGSDANLSTSYMTSPADTTPTLQPHSKHVASNPCAGNYLFLDGHVEWNEKMSPAMSTTDPTMLTMFPPPPTLSGGTVVPCP